MPPAVDGPYVFKCLCCSIVAVSCRATGIQGLITNLVPGTTYWVPPFYRDEVHARSKR